MVCWGCEVYFLFPIAVQVLELQDELPKAQSHLADVVLFFWGWCFVGWLVGFSFLVGWLVWVGGLFC